MFSTFIEDKALSIDLSLPLFKSEGDNFNVKQLSANVNC